jgi:hypothetical protein
MASMVRPQPIHTRTGRKPGELVVSLPPGWELRLRRVLRQMNAEVLPDPREKGLRPAQRQARVRARRRHMNRLICQFVSDLLTADIVGKEVAFATRSRFGARKGSLREQVQALMREAAGS